MRSALGFMFVAIDATGNVIETPNPAGDLKNGERAQLVSQPFTQRVRVNLRDIKRGD